MQQQRRRDPYPWTWEIPVAATATLLLGCVLGIHLGRALANLLAGSGWTWPDTTTSSGVATPIGRAFWTSIPAVLAGHAEAGLPSDQATGVAGPELLWSSVAATEATLLAAMTWAGVQIYRRWGPGRMLGMASRHQAEKLLGVTRLRKVSHIIRPDLYGKTKREPRVRRLAGSTPEPTVELGRGLSPWLLPGRFGRPLDPAEAETRRVTLGKNPARGNRTNSRAGSARSREDYAGRAER